MTSWPWQLIFSPWTHTFNFLDHRTTCVSWYQKGKTNWILLKRETVSGSGISWAICKSATPHSRQITTPAPHHSVVYRPDALPATQPTASHIVGHMISPPLIVSIVWLSILELWVMMSCIACFVRKMATHTHARTHVRLMEFCPGLPGWTGTREVKPIWILLEQESVSGSGISWTVCKSAPRSRQITTPAPHHSVFTGRMPFLPPNQQCQSTEGNCHWLEFWNVACFSMW